MTVTKALYKYLDELPPCEISGWQLFEIMKDVTGKNTYPSTLLKMCREYADISGADFECIDNKKSIYRYKPCVKISNAIIGGKE